MFYGGDLVQVIKEDSLSYLKKGVITGCKCDKAEIFYFTEPYLGILKESDIERVRRPPLRKFNKWRHNQPHLFMQICKAVGVSFNKTGNTLPD